MSGSSCRKAGWGTVCAVLALSGCASLSEPAGSGGNSRSTMGAQSKPEKQALSKTPVNTAGAGPQMMGRVTDVQDASPRGNGASGSDATTNAATNASRSWQAINITPFSRYVDEGAEGKAVDAGKAVDPGFAGAYTRFVIESEVHASRSQESSQQEAGSGAEPPPLTLPYQPRPWLERALVGKELSINLTVRLGVGAYEQTVPLVTVGHSSNSSGEKWVRAIQHDVRAFPLFLVKGDGTASMPRVQYTVKASNTYAARGAAAALGVAVQVARALVVEPAVMTRLTSEAMRSEAQALDQAISQLFSSALTEEHGSHRDLSRVMPAANGRASGARIELWIPVGEDWDASRRQVGLWRITFEAPRPSIFVDWRICQPSQTRCTGTAEQARAAVVRDIAAAEVLNYKLMPANGDLGTIRAYLGSQDWYNAALTAFATQTDRALTQSATAFCRRVVAEITGLDLSDFDGAAVLWAVYRGMPAAFPDFANVTGCRQALREFADRL